MRRLKKSMPQALDARRVPQELVAMSELYRELREVCIDHLLMGALDGEPTLRESARALNEFSFFPNRFAFDIFLIAPAVARLRELCPRAQKRVAKRLLARVEPMEGALQRLLAPLDEAYLGKLAHFFKCYARFQEGEDYPLADVFTELYQKQLLTPCNENYALLHGLAQELPLQEEEVLSRKREVLQREAHEALEALEVQYLLNNPAELSSSPSS